MTHATILVVEDNPTTRKMVRVALTGAGYEVLEAPDGRTALELMAQAVPDLVLQDVLLPDMDGVELVARLRALPGGGEVPILAFWGFLSRLDTARALALGFSDFLVKPFEPSQLVQTVRSYLPVADAAAGNPGQGRRILVVDDDPIQLKLARRQLTRLGFQVTTASAGLAAIEQAGQSPPDAILSDVLMPHLDGFQLCLAVRRDPRLAAVPVVLCSANYLDEADRRLAERVGANALVTRMPDFGDAIAALLASLSEPAPPAPQGPVDAREVERLQRVVRQLERQAAMNVGLIQRLSLQASVLSMLAGLSSTLGRPLDVEVAPADLFASLLDAGGISTGALYLAGPGGRLRFHAQSGDPDVISQEAEQFFGHPELFERCVELGQPITVPSAAVPEQTARAFLGRVGAVSAVIVPLVSRDERIGALLMAATRRNLTHPDWLAFAQTMAGQIAQTIALGRAFSRLTTSDQRYRSLFDNVPVGLYRTTLEGRFLDANRALVELLGYPDRESLMAVDAVDLYANLADRRAWQASADRDGVVRGFEVQLRRRDGTPVWVWLNVRALREGDGEPVYEGSLEDITERKRTEEALRQSEERFRRAFEDSAVGMALQDTDGRYLRVNQALCTMLGYSEQELVGVISHTLVHPDDREVDREHDRRMLVAGQIGWHQLEKRYLHKLGHLVWALTSVSLVRDRQGRPAYLIAQAQDLTERKRAEEELGRQRATLGQAEKLAAMGQLLAGVAHELNNPLSVVLGQSVLLQTKLGSGPLAERAVKIGQAAERCARIVKNFLALARQRPPERQHVRLNEVVAEALELLAYPLRVDNVTVQRALAPDLPVLWADPHQLHQVVVNLVVNAHQAMREVEGPRRLTVITRFDRAAGRVTLEVSDSGPGIPPEIRTRIFEPFFTTKPPGQGTGLGLSLCQGIVERHGGAITVESLPGQGTVFRVELPVSPAPAPAPPTRPAEPPPIRGKTVLVVDDEPEVAEVLADFLTEDDHTVEIAANGVDALRKLGARRYDLVLSDLKMPELDGPGLYREVQRRHPELVGRFAFLTGDTLSPQITRFLDEVVAPSLNKPFTLAEVRRVTQKLLEAT